MSTLHHAILVLLVTGLPAAAADWWPGFAPAGALGSVNVLTEHGGDLIAGGSFSTIGGAAAANVARWDGTVWRAIDGGTDGRVTCLLSLQTSLMIGGWFLEAGGRDCPRVAKLELGEWSPLGTDQLDWWPNALIMHGAVLYAGGRFDPVGNGSYCPLNYWDDFHWRNVVDGVDPNNEVHALAERDGRLWLGGDFTFDALPDDIHSLCVWDGADFTGYGFTNGDVVNALRFHDTELYVGGVMIPSGGAGGSGLVRITAGGSVAQVDQWDVPRIVVDLDEWNGALLVCQSDAVIPYSGLAWGDTLGGVMDGELHDVETVGGRLYVAGSFPGEVARWDPVWDEWVLPAGAPGDGVGPAHQITAFGAWNGALVAAGEFSIPALLAGRPDSDKVGVWDGEAWHRLGGGFDGEVRAFAIYDGELIAGGWFGRAGTGPAANLAAWDGSDWRELGGLDGEANAMVVHDGELIVGGAFRNAGGTAVERVAAWNGTSWRALGTGISGIVETLAVHDGELYAGGIFFQPTGKLARWDGARWQSVGGGVNGAVHALTTFEGDLLVGGWFTEAGGTPAVNVARWDGAAFHALGDGFSGGSAGRKVSVLMPVNGELLAGGDFDRSGSTPLSGLAAWDGASWRAFGGGLQVDSGVPTVQDLRIHGGDLYVGGIFDRVGDDPVPAADIARWVDGTLVSVESDDDPDAPPAAPARLLSAHPNPCNPRTVIRLSLAVPGWARVAVYDAGGRLVRVLAARDWDVGAHELAWDGCDARGRAVPSGVYLVRADTDRGREALKLTLVR